jgi:hypothetical protein
MLDQISINPIPKIVAVKMFDLEIYAYLGVFLCVHDWVFTVRIDTYSWSTKNPPKWVS